MKFTFKLMLLIAVRGLVMSIEAKSADSLIHSHCDISKLISKLSLGFRMTAVGLLVEVFVVTEGASLNTMR